MRMLKVKLQELSPFFDTGIRPKANALYPEYVGEISDATKGVKLANPRSF